MSKYPVFRQFQSINHESIRYVNQWKKANNYGKSEYDIKANEVADELGITLSVNRKWFGSMSWDKDGKKRWIFNLTLAKNKNEYTFDFGQSLAANFAEPTMYDVLACLTKYDPGSFDDFCSDFGYSNDSISALHTYGRVMEEWLMMARMFSHDELELLREIQ